MKHVNKTVKNDRTHLIALLSIAFATKAAAFGLQTIATTNIRQQLSRYSLLSVSSSIDALSSHTEENAGASEIENDVKIDIEDLVKQANDFNNDSSELISSNVGTEDGLSQKEIMVSASVKLPFSAELAFDAFSDLPRQPSYSTWLNSCTYIDDEISEDVQYSQCGIPMRETKWVMGWKKIRYSWNSKVTRVERPYVIEWKSTSGLKNMGVIEFVEVDVDMNDENTEISSSDVVTEMTMVMKFVAPTLVAKLFRRSAKISTFMERRIVTPTLLKFRDIVMEKDLKMDVESIRHVLSVLDKE
mmetsp:Transcript_33176/g.39739  ORF Transcript_33176/g.39739 Transcript_33176/m.39739 type:complete len:301 (+) Transcript_33176:49-951(+)